MKSATIVAFLGVTAFLAVTCHGASVGSSVRDACSQGGNCAPPDCRCSAIRNPGYPTVQAPQVPQMVFLTFDDAITNQNLEIYNEIFNGERKNPNGAKITGTFFISHENNQYPLTNKLWMDGHEIAVHSITHTALTTYWTSLSEEDWRAEMVDMRKMLHHFGGIPIDDMKGYRAPLLQGGADKMYNALIDDFSYESSRPTWSLRPVLWPYTADFDTIQDCQISPCPTANYPDKKFWVHPLVDLLGVNNNPCAFADTCETPDTPAGVTEWLYKNFYEHLVKTSSGAVGRRAPFGIYTHASWLLNDTIKDGYIGFIDKILNDHPDDVYIVSVNRGLDWMRTADPNPATLDDLLDETSSKAPASWRDVERSSECDFNRLCIFEEDKTPEKFQEKTMYVCELCPPFYPWLHNWDGTKSYPLP